MPSFKLDRFSIELPLEPLGGPHAAADRQVAWRLYLALTLRPDLRAESLQPQAMAAVQRLLADIEQMLVDWPAAQPGTSMQPQHLGPALARIVEFVLLPCLLERGAAAAWPAVRGFCQELAREVARQYRFFDAGVQLPADLRAAWRGAGER